MFHRLAFPLLYFLAPRLLPKIFKFARLVWGLTFGMLSQLIELAGLRPQPGSITPPS